MGKNILVVDNHPVLLKWIRGLLEKEGHQVLTAEDGLSALDILETHVPEVVFIDLVMPNIDGGRLCRMIRKNPKLRDAWLVIFSAIAAEGKIDFTEFGANACIAKGSFNQMAQNILLILDETERKTAAGQPGHIMGLENVYPRQITKELLSVRKHFDVILKSMSEGILEVSPKGRIIYTNPKAISLIGVPEERLLASNIIDIFHEGDQQGLKEMLSAIDDHPQMISTDAPLRLNGKHVLLSLLPITNDEDKTVIILFTDVSEQKRMEEQILQAQKVEAIGTLAGGIAHDFNNLLMAIQGNASLMLMEMDTFNPHYEMIKSIEHQVQRGSKLTSQLLAYARKGRYDVKPLDLNRLVEEISDTFGRTRKEITIQRELDRGLFSIEAEQGQMEQVLMNLLINASDAMPGGGDLHLKTANVTPEEMKIEPIVSKRGQYVLLTVTDTGIGMDERTLERIFDPFFTTKELGRGTGLGLASVYGIVKSHQGYIHVQSEIGKGSTFLIYLPASRKKVQEPVKKVDQVIRGIETILLVDDEKFILEVGERLLTKLGYNVLRAESGEKAIKVYEENREKIAMVILDMVMPQEGGGKTFDRLKEMNPNVKVLLASGYSMEGQAMEIMKRGCSGFIQKPFTFKELSQKLREILDPKK